MYRGPLALIAVLLTGWLVIVEWQSFPSLAATVLHLAP
jgi:hypothetical protein